MSSSVDLSILPDDARAALEAAKNAAAQPRRAEEHAKKALAAVDFPTHEGRSAYCLPGALTPAQRTVATVLAEEPFGWMQLMPYALPFHVWARKVWLGLVPGGVLESTQIDVDGAKRPLWRALQLAQAEDSSVGAVLNELPFEVAIAAIGELLLQPAVYDIAAVDHLFRNGNLRLVRELKDEGRDWAFAIAEPRPPRNVPRNTIPGLGPFIYFAVMRAGVPIDAKWEVFFPDHVEAVGEEIFHECVRALPPERRDALVTKTLRYSHRTFAWPLIQAFPSAAAARKLLDFPPDDPKHSHCPPRSEQWKWWIRRLGTLGKKHPEILEVVRAATGAAPPPLDLLVASITMPKRVEDLTPVQQKQVRVAGKGFDGKDLPAKERMADDGPDDETNPSFYGTLELRSITDAAGKRRYDVLQYATDAGTLFEAGKVEEFGWIGQGRGISLKKPDERLRVALQDLVGVNARMLDGKRTKRVVKTVVAKRPAEGKKVAKRRVVATKAAKTKKKRLAR